MIVALLLVIGLSLAVVIGVLGWWQARQQWLWEKHFQELQQRLLGQYQEQSSHHPSQAQTWQRQWQEWHQMMEHKMGNLESKVRDQLQTHHFQQNTTLRSMAEQLGKFDESRKHIEGLSLSLQQLNHVLTDNKTRGIFGEVQLKQLLVAIFGENSRLFQLQYSLSTGKIGDAVVFAPAPIGKIVIDSKFALESFQRFWNEEHDPTKQLTLLKQSLKTKINDIAEKYIVAQETAEYAVMFIPAEGVFAFMHNHLPEIVEYGYQKKVWVTSPTTLMALLSVIQSVVLQIKQSQQAQQLQQEIGYLANEFRLFAERMGKLERDYQHLQNDFHNLQVTGKKITKSFTRIQALEDLEQKGMEIYEDEDY